MGGLATPAGAVEAARLSGGGGGAQRDSVGDSCGSSKLQQAPAAAVTFRRMSHKVGGAAWDRYSAAQRVYVVARRRVGRVGVDDVMMDLLRYGIVWGELDSALEMDLDVLGRLLRSAGPAEVREVHLGLGLRSTVGPSGVSVSRRPPAAVLERGANAALARSLRFGLEARNCALTRIELAGVPLSAEAARELGAGLLRNASVASGGCVRFLSLAGSRLGDAALSALAPGLSALAALQDLVLRECALSDASSGALAGVLRAHATRRADGRWGSSLRRGAGTLTREALSPAEEDHVALQGLLTVDLALNALGDTWAAALARELLADDWLGAVNLAGNRVGAAGVDALSRALENQNEALAVLDLRDNDPAAAEAVAALDALLRARSALPDRGVLSRRLPELRADKEAKAASPKAASSPTAPAQRKNRRAREEEQRELELEGPFSACVVAAAIVRWQAGHQLAPGVTSLVAAVATAPAADVNVQMAGLPLGPKPGLAAGATGLSSAPSARAPHGARPNAAGASLDSTWASPVRRPGAKPSAKPGPKPGESLTTFESSIIEWASSEGEPESAEPEAKAGGEPEAKAGGEPEAKPVTRRRDRDRPAAAKGKNAAPTAARTTSANTSSKAASQRGSAAARRRPAKAAAQPHKASKGGASEVDKTFRWYADMLAAENPGMAKLLDGAAANSAGDKDQRGFGSIQVLEQSVEQLNRVLEQISASEAAVAGGGRRSPADRTSPVHQQRSPPRQRSPDEEIMDEVTDKVAARLAAIWT